MSTQDHSKRWTNAELDDCTGPGVGDGGAGGEGLGGVGVGGAGVGGAGVGGVGVGGEGGAGVGGPGGAGVLSQQASIILRRSLVGQQSPANAAH